MHIHPLRRLPLRPGTQQHAHVVAQSAALGLHGHLLHRLGLRRCPHRTS